MTPITKVGDLYRLGAWALKESNALEFDKVYADGVNKVIVCGEIAHLSYRLQMAHLDAQLALEINQMMARFAESVGVARVDKAPASH